MKVKDKNFEIFIEESAIKKRVKEIANFINRDYQGKDPLFLCVLNGSFMFAADLMKEVNIPSRITFIKLSSYVNLLSTGNVKETIALEGDITNKDIIVVEDIVDTGNTLDFLEKKLQALEPASYEVVTLLLKPEALQKEVKIKYIGFEIPNKFVVGYGLDYDGYGRNLKDIYQLKE